MAELERHLVSLLKGVKAGNLEEMGPGSKEMSDSMVSVMEMIKSNPNIVTALLPAQGQQLLKTSGLLKASMYMLKSDVFQKRIKESQEEGSERSLKEASSLALIKSQ
jgi:hypothetical protein